MPIIGHPAKVKTKGKNKGFRLNLHDGRDSDKQSITRTEEIKIPNNNKKAGKTL